MARIDVDVLEQSIIEVIREARASQEKNASRHIDVANRTLKIHVTQTNEKTWTMRIVTKKE